MKKDVSVGKHVDVVMARVTALRASCFVRPKHFAAGIGDGEYVFPIGSGNENQALGLQEGGESEEYR